VYTGNVGGSSSYQTNTVNPPIVGTYIRLIPETVSGFESLQADLQGCATSSQATTATTTTTALAAAAITTTTTTAPAAPNAVADLMNMDIMHIHVHVGPEEN